MTERNGPGNVWGSTRDVAKQRGGETRTTPRQGSTSAEPFNVRRSRKYVVEVNGQGSLGYQAVPRRHNSRP
jgi:hypothetical protein